VPLALFVLAEVISVAAPGACDTVILPVLELYTALPDPALIVPPEMNTSPVEALSTT